LQAVERALSEAVQLSTSQAAPLLSAPWGLHFIAHASSSALLLSSRALLQAVRVWKAASAMAGAAGLASGSGNGGRGRPVLMARVLNHQSSWKEKQQQQQQGGKAGGSAGTTGNSSSNTVSATILMCGRSASILSQWIKGPGGNSLAAAAGAAAVGTAAAVQEEHVETIECLGTSLLLMLQSLPAQHLAAAREAAAASAARPSSPSPSKRAAAMARAAQGAAADAAAAAARPAELLELEAALVELLPGLCKACATAVSQQQDAAAAAAAHGALPAAAGTAAELQARQAYVAVMLQLLIEILRHQLPSALWLAPVSRHLDLVPMLTAVAARANSLGPLPPPPPVGVAAAGSAAAGYSSSDAAAAAAAAVGVTDISVLELLQAVAEVQEGALQLWQQGVLPVLIGFCRQLLHGPDQSGLLGAAALGIIGPDASILTGANGGSASLAAAAAAAGDGSPQSAVTLSTVGAYVAAGGSSGSSGSGSSTDMSMIWSARHQQWCLLLALWSSVMQQLSRTVRVSDIAMAFLTAAEPRLQLAVQLHSSYYHSLHSSSGSKGVGGGDPDHDTPASRALVLAIGGTLDRLAPGSGQGSASSSAVLLTLGNLLEAERALLLLKFMVNDVGDWELQRPGSLAGFRSAAASLIEFVALPSLER